MRPHLHRHSQGALAALILALSSPLLLAAPSRSTIGNPGGYVTTCISASSTSGGGANPGDNFEVNFAAGSCTSDVFSGMGGSASAQQSPVAGDSITGGAVGSVSLGAIHLGSQYALQQGGNFPGAVATGGFKTEMTVNNAALDGQAGYMLFDLDVSGGLKANGNAGSARFMLLAFINDNPLMASAPGWNLGTGIEASTDRQMAVWEASSYPYPFEGDSQDVDETLTFSVPITFGTAFNLGIYGVSGVGGRNQSGVGSAHSDFSHSMYWAGVRGVLVNGQLIETGLSIASNAGIDWMKSLVPAAPPGTVPEPATLPLAMGAIGLAAIGLRRPRRGVRGRVS